MKVAILGFGIEGKDALQYFLPKAETVTVFDQKLKEELSTEQYLASQDVVLRGYRSKINWVCGPNYLDNGLNDYDLIVRSPGFYRYNPILLEAEKNGAKITSPTIIFFENCKKPIIGVTGTKGKGTTSSLIAEGLKACGKKVVLLGNIGEPMLSSLDEANYSDFVVLELSSFQTIDLPISPHVAVITNITSDHLDWHKDNEEYIQAKAQLWANQTKDDYLVINEDDEISVKLAKSAPGNVQTYNGVNEKASQLIIPGKHNVYNANAALLAVKFTGVDLEKAWYGITQFKGLEHRLEKVAEIGDVTYINDSYATNPEPTLAAIHSFEQPKVLILGGSKKGADFTKMAEEIAKSNVQAVVLIGDESENINEKLKTKNYKGVIKNGGQTMEEIVKAAKELASPGDMIILSPACASFGLFQNYKDRGKQFKEAVLKLNSN